jgi:hypothetical protein
LFFHSILGADPLPQFQSLPPDPPFPYCLLKNHSFSSNAVITTTATANETNSNISEQGNVGGEPEAEGGATAANISTNSNSSNSSNSSMSYADMITTNAVTNTNMNHMDMNTMQMDHRDMIRHEYDETDDTIGAELLEVILYLYILHCLLLLILWFV